LCCTCTDFKKMDSEPVRFQVPQVFNNPTGWGPTEECIPQKFIDLPYAPFSKGDKLGKVADLSGFSAKYTRGHKEGVTNAAFSFRDTEEEGFQLVVDSTGQKKTRGGFRTRASWRGKKPQAGQRRRGDQQQSKQSFGRHHEQRRKQQFGGRGGARGGRGGFPGFRRFDQKVIKESSVEVKSEWVVLEQLDFNQLGKLKTDEVPEPEDIAQCGALEYYDKDFDRLTVKTKKPLKRIERTFFKVTTTDDPVIKRLSLENASEGNVIFGTDAILSLLMCCPRSHYSWDVIVRRVGAKMLFFDKRDKSQFDYLTVNETATETPREDDKDPINTPQSLSLEASYINQNFSQQVLAPGNRHSFPAPNPFQGNLTDEEVAPVGYRYRKWDFGDGNVLIARCELDAVTKQKDEDEFLSIKALNEYDPAATGLDWRQKLDSQRGAVLATELKNNSNKLARWTAQALLAGASQIKLGYVSRTNTKDAYNHQVLGVQSYKPTEFANQINLNENNMWAILKHIIDICMELEPGTYVLLKDPNKRLVRLYSVPEDSFIGGGEEEAEEEFGEYEEEGDADGEEEGL